VTPKRGTEKKYLFSSSTLTLQGYSKKLNDNKGTKLNDWGQFTEKCNGSK